MKNFNIFGFTEKSDFKGKEKNNIEGGGLPKKGGLARKGEMFWGGWGLIPYCTLYKLTNNAMQKKGVKE